MIYQVSKQVDISCNLIKRDKQFSYAEDFPQKKSYIENIEPINNYRINGS
jgi:hypothetical protein